MEKMDNITVKFAASKDNIEEIAELVKKYREFYKVSAQDINEIKNFIHERLSNLDSKIFVARNEDTGNLIGFIQLYPLFSTVSLKRQWMLNDFYVLETERKKGVGTMLMNAVFEYFKDKAKGCILVTDKTNTTAKEFYNKLGWKTDTYDFYTYYF